MKKLSATKILVIINVVIFLALPLILGEDKALDLKRDMAFFSESPQDWWTVITHIFFHSSTNHLLFNSIALWSFGIGLEQYCSQKKYLTIYFLSGIAGVLAQYIFKSEPYLAIGASGAICGIVGAICFLQPNQKLLLLFIIPMKMKWAFPLVIIASVLMHFTEILKGVGHLAHVGGLVCGYLLAKFTIPRAPEFFFTEDGIIEMRQDHGQP